MSQEASVSEELLQLFEAVKSLPSGSVKVSTMREAIRTVAGKKQLNTSVDGSTLLCLACGLGMVDWVKALLKEGADPNAKDGKGNTPLHMLASYHYVSLAPLLLNAGANPDIQNEEGKVPLDLAVGRHAVLLLDELDRRSGKSQTLPESFSRFTDPSIAGFLRYIGWKAAQLSVEFRLVDAPSVPYNGNPEIPVSGFFVAQPTPVLGVAIGKEPEEWLEILAHESSHMDQWAENSPAWTGNIMSDGREAVDWIDEWISGKELSQEVLEKAVVAAKAVELDCEVRTISKIRSFSLPLLVEKYAQRANAYVHFYSHVAKTRTWNETGRAPYQLEEVWGKAPKFLVEEATPEMEAAYNAIWPIPVESSSSVKLKRPGR